MAKKDIANVGKSFTDLDGFQFNYDLKKLIGNYWYCYLQDMNSFKEFAKETYSFKRHKINKSNTY